jgi:hypothetical protein
VFTVQVVVEDTATPALERIAAGLTSEELLPRFGRSVMHAMQENFDELEETRPNKLGGTRQHYYAEASRLTRFTVSGDTATVYTTEVGTNLRYYGGTVVPVTAKYLTIPATAEAYGHRAADFPELEVLYGRNGPYALGRVERRTIQRGEEYGASRGKLVEVLFWLRKSVEIPADETMLPTSEAIDENVRGDFNSYVNRLWKRAGG